MAGDQAPDPSAWRRRRLAAITGSLMGLIVGGVAMGTAQLVAGIVNPGAFPVLTVGQSVIDATPEWLKGAAIRTFGPSDKSVLLAGIGVVLALAAIALGIASVYRLWVGVVGLAAFGAIGVAAALARPVAMPRDVLPAIAATAVGLLTLVAIRSCVRFDATGATRGGGGEPPRVIDRRRFLLFATAGFVGALAAGGAGNFFARRFRADSSRAAVDMPPPASRAAAIDGAELHVPGLPPFITPNERFYRVDTALFAPAVTAEDWSLRIHGMVRREIMLDYKHLLSRALIERDITLTCVSNVVGGPYVGNARWIGAPLRELLAEAGPLPGADQIVSRSVDGFTVGTPTAVAMDGRDAMLAVAMNGEPLPIVHGFPVRMIVPGLYGYVSATKWIVDIELTRFDAYDPYWVQRGWAEQAPIKTMSRIDTPSPNRQLRAGEIPIAGVAWAQEVGIDRVDVAIDDGPWLMAELAAEDTIDTWRQWLYRWEATSGEHLLRVRAIDRTGAPQTPVRTDPFPNGATGHHTIAVVVR
jgi:DMSO/TMAO reductase YedYZ molybdopterin-dependent catalytic subunit